MLVLDTSAVSALMHRRPEALGRLRTEDRSGVFLSAPVAAEIHFGLSRLQTGSRRRLLLEREFRRCRAVLRWTEWNAPAARLFGHWKARLQRREAAIEDMDLAIASIALSLRARLATTNLRHFVRIDGLEVDDWSPGKLRDGARAAASS